MQGLDTVADGCHHAFDLVVFAFGQRQAEQVFTHDFGSGSSNRFVLIGEQDAGQQLVDLPLIKRVLGRRQIDFRHLAFGRGKLMVQLAIVGDQQETGGVFVETADGLDITLAQGHRQQFEDAGVVFRLARAFVAGGLVEHQRGVFGVGPIDAIDGENQTFDVEFDERIVANLAIDRDTSASDEAPAFPTGTEAVFLEDTF